MECQVQRPQTWLTIVNPAADPVRLYTERSRSYLRFIRLAAYPQGIRAYFKRSPWLRSRLRVLDAGCGTGTVALALREAMLGRGFQPGALQGFDLTPKMLDDFHETLRMQGIEGVNLAQADVLELGTLPQEWNNFDLVVSAAMMEYLPRRRLVDALSGLRSLLNESGRVVLFITRNNWLMSPIIGRWWDANLYQAAELEESFRLAGFSTVTFGSFPFPYKHLSLWGHIIEAGA
jgi:SAM-dependent methyltransferase